jgi:hypothetical protein
MLIDRRSSPPDLRQFSGFTPTQGACPSLELIGFAHSRETWATRNQNRSRAACKKGSLMGPRRHHDAQADQNAALPSSGCGNVRRRAVGRPVDPAFNVGRTAMGADLLSNRRHARVPGG